MKSPSSTSSTAQVKDDGLSQSATPPSSNQSDSNVPNALPGNFTGQKDQVNFVGNEHWESILEDIADLKIDLETPDTSAITDFKPQILFGVAHASRSEIMSSIPPKEICDMLISRWFRTMDMAPSKLTANLSNIRSTDITTVVVHAPTFMKEVSNSEKRMKRIS